MDQDYKIGEFFLWMMAPFFLDTMLGGEERCVVLTVSLSY